MLFVCGCLAGMVVAAGFGFVVGLPSLRLRGDYLAIVTLGFGEIVRVLLQQTDDVLFDKTAIAETPITSLPFKVGGALGFTGLPFYTSLFWVWLAVGLTVLVAYRLKESTHGRAYLAIREDEIAAEAIGVPTTRIKVRAFVISAAFAGLAGALFAHEVGTTLNPRELGFQRSFEVVIMVVLGGMGSISGTVLAATVLTVLPELLRSVEQYRMIAYALTLILMMLLRPQGLFGLHEIWEIGPFRRRGPK
jgi:branched-chain amino acid transport system permease protein